MSSRSIVFSPLSPLSKNFQSLSALFSAVFSSLGSLDSSSLGINLKMACNRRNVIQSHLESIAFGHWLLDGFKAVFNHPQIINHLSLVAANMYTGEEITRILGIFKVVSPSVPRLDQHDFAPSRQDAAQCTKSLEGVSDTLVKLLD